MKDIDLSGYTETELIELNHRVIERIRTLQQARVRGVMTEFRVGDRVSFSPECGHEVKGTVVRLNRKSVTVVTAEGAHWRVAPVVLKKEASVSEVQGNVFDFAALRQREHGKA
jgi:hypothetical protein